MKRSLKKIAGFGGGYRSISPVQRDRSVRVGLQCLGSTLSAVTCDQAWQSSTMGKVRCDTPRHLPYDKLSSMHQEDIRLSFLSYFLPASTTPVCPEGQEGRGGGADSGRTAWRLMQVYLSNFREKNSAFFSLPRRLASN